MAELTMDRMRRLLRASREARAAKARTPPQLTTGEGSGRPRILYLSPDPKVPRGGVRVIYRHVEILRRAGFEAAVVHQRPGYRAEWFESSAPVLDAREAAVTPHDVIVVPEFFGARLAALPSRARLVLFNQGPFYTFDGLPADRGDVLADPRVSAILTVSDYGVGLLRHAFPDVPVHLARSVIDPTLFHPPQAPASGRRIAYAASRRHHERHQLLSILHLRGRIADWELVPIVGMSEQQVAQTLRGCELFLSFSEQDGFGLPPAEAMASGCYVIGYSGYGGSEFFDPAYCRPVPDGDLLGFARAIDETLDVYQREPEVLRAAGLAASRAVLERYDEDLLGEELIAFYAALV